MYRRESTNLSQKRTKDNLTPNHQKKRGGGDFFSMEDRLKQKQTNK